MSDAEARKGLKLNRAAAAMSHPRYAALIIQMAFTRQRGPIIAADLDFIFDQCTQESGRIGSRGQDL